MTNTNVLLLRTPEPVDGEGILGYVLRLSEANGYDTPWHVLRHAGYEQGEMRTAGFSVRKLAAIVGKDPELLEPHAYTAQTKDGRREYRLNGHFIGHSLAYGPLRLGKPAICPSCVMEDGFAHVCWDATAYVACPRHGMYLVTKCPTCEAALSWFRPGLLKCKCGASLATVSASPAPPAAIALMRVLHDRITNVAYAADAGRSMPFGPLAQMPLESLLRLVATLTKLRARCMPAVKTDQGSRSAAEIFSDWPHGFHAYLRRLAANDDPAVAPGLGLRKRFTRFYQAVFKSRVRFTGIDFLRDEFVRFGTHEWGEALVDRKLLRTTPVNAKFVSRTALATRLGVMPVTAGRLMRKGVIPNKAVELLGGRRYIADSSVVDGTLRSPADCLEAREAGKFTGLPVSVLEGLKRTGHYSTNPVVNHLRGYWPPDLAALERRIVAIASSSSAASEIGARPCDLVDLGRFLLHWKLGSPHSKAAFVAAVLDGQIAPVKDTCSSWRNVRFHVTALEAFRVQHALGSGRETLSARAAAVRAGCNSSAIAGLLAAGHVQHAADGVRVSKTSLEAFLKKWRPLNAVASTLGTTSNGLLPHIDRLKIPLLKVPFYTRGQQALFISASDAEMICVSLSGKIRTRRQIRQLRQQSHNDSA
jgi:hypothetical protein